ncbi:MAG: hypothetical protein ACRYF3_01555 [Janthinobacterium lividum]
MSDPYAPLPDQPPLDQIPHRRRQQPPSDPVQAQLHLLVQAVQTLSEAVAHLDQHRNSLSSRGMSIYQAQLLTHQVAQLGGWVESLQPTGTPLRTEHGWLILD